MFYHVLPRGVFKQKPTSILVSIPCRYSCIFLLIMILHLRPFPLSSSSLFTPSRFPSSQPWKRKQVCFFLSFRSSVMLLSSSCVLCKSFSRSLLLSLFIRLFSYIFSPLSRRHTLFLPVMSRSPYSSSFSLFLSLHYFTISWFLCFFLLFVFFYLLSSFFVLILTFTLRTVPLLL